MISAPTIELGYVDDFWVGSDSVFINDFYINSRTCALIISASAVELGCIDKIWVNSDLVFVNDF